MLHNSESLPSDAAYWNSSNIPPKLRSQNAAHTTARSQ